VLRGLITITCGICGSKNRLYARTMAYKFNNYSKKSNEIFKCKFCKAVLTIIRLKGACKARWLAPQDDEMNEPLTV